jgi:hypothetical protein
MAAPGWSSRSSTFAEASATSPRSIARTSTNAAPTAVSIWRPNRTAERPRSSPTKPKPTSRFRSAPATSSGGRASRSSTTYRTASTCSRRPSASSSSQVSSGGGAPATRSAWARRLRAPLRQVPAALARGRRRSPPRPESRRRPDPARRADHSLRPLAARRGARQLRSDRVLDRQDRPPRRRFHRARRALPLGDRVARAALKSPPYSISTKVRRGAPATSRRST